MSIPNYLLVDANSAKLGGYVNVRSKFLYDMANILYANQPSGRNYIIRRISKLESEHGQTIPISCFTDGMCYTQKYLVSSKTSNILRMIYVRGQLDIKYSELAFVLFITGMVDSADYLSMFRDVNRVVGRFNVKIKAQNRSSDDVLRQVLISQKSYISMMMLYIQNCLNGIDYGVPMYDFVYHILKTAGLKSIKRKGSYYSIYVRIIEDIKYVQVPQNFRLHPSDAELVKYAEELAFMVSAFPYMFDSSIIERLFGILVSKNCVVFIEIMLRSPDFILNFERGCIKCGIS